MESFRCLPGGLLAKIWPAERVVLGIRVCKWLRNELRCSDLVQLTAQGNCAGMHDSTQIFRTFCFFRTNNLILRWHKMEQCCLDALVSSVSWSMASILCNSLVQLDLSKNRFGDEDLGRLAKAFSDCNRLLHLDLSQLNSVGGAGARSIAAMLGQCARLQSLNLSNNRLGNESVGRIMDAVSEACPQLTHLDLGSDEISYEGLCKLSTSLTRCTKLKRLHLSHNSILSAGTNVSTLQPLRAIFLSCPEFEVLDIAGNGMEDLGLTGLAEVIAQSPSLTELDLQLNAFTHWGSARLSALGQCSQLRKLYLSENSLGTHGCDSTLKHAHRTFQGWDSMTSLRVLELHSASLTDQEATLLASLIARCSLLTSLDLRRNALRESAAVALGAVLRGCTGLRSLALGSNRIGDKGCAALAEGLVVSSRLSSLGLGSNSVGRDGIERLCAALPAMRHLTRLSVGRNMIGQEGLALLAPALAQCSVLGHLDLHRTCMGDAGAARLAAVLACMTALWHLDLRDNMIGNGGAVKIVSATRTCTRLQHLNISANEVDEETLASLRLRMPHGTQTALISLSLAQLMGVPGL